jgi:hypothetical protein
METIGNEGAAEHDDTSEDDEAMVCDSEPSSSDDGMFFPKLREDYEW